MFIWCILLLNTENARTKEGQCWLLNDSNIRLNCVKLENDQFVQPKQESRLFAVICTMISDQMPLSHNDRRQAFLELNNSLLELQMQSTMQLRKLYDPLIKCWCLCVYVGESYSLTMLMLIH